MLPPDTNPAAATSAPLDALPRYPRIKDARLRSIEGFVDLARVARTQGCVTFARELSESSPRATLSEFAPWGPSSLWLDGRPLVVARGAMHAVLGKGIRIPIDLPAGSHRLVVQTCTDESLTGGFYLRELRIGN